MINWIISGGSNGGYSESLLKDMKLWMDVTKDFLCTHIMREGNMAANYMAGVGVRGSSVQYTGNFLPKELRRIRREERMERSCKRKA